ncbi:MAG: putative hydrolase of the HAD superfamily [Oceanicoccus sp.]|jgi:putative hydrolase of the HAD superfamily
MGYDNEIMTPDGFRAISNEFLKLFRSDSNNRVEDGRDHWMNSFPETTVAMRGANEFVSYLSGQGYHVGTISNGADKSRKSTAEKLESFCHIKQIISSE